ncbi:MAG: YicC family protein [Candidatus Sumerlaeia bacterium]|nr:YicC family protein [Candidatus Sumerlaeia bacterium]
MPRSMTGFGRAARGTPHGRVTAEVRAVNARFNETRVRLPAEVLELDMRLRDRIRAALTRGKIDCTVRFERAIEDIAPSLRPEAFRAAFRALHEAAAGLPLAEGVTVEAVLRAMPREDFEAEVWSDEAFQGEIEQAVSEALEALTAAREAEGHRMAEALSGHLAQIEEAAAQVRQLAPQVAESYGVKLRQRLEELTLAQGVTPDQGRIEQELVHYAQRIDVTEELDRLDAHCLAFRELLAVNTPVGRRMDFLVQEILREVNTLGSKAKDAGILGQVIGLKVVVEQMREQVQNIE